MFEIMFSFIRHSRSMEIEIIVQYAIAKTQ